MAYYHALNTGNGFITHEENQSAHISGHPGDIWITDNTSWALRVNAIEKTKEEAQSIIDAELLGQVYSEEHENAGEQVTYLLP